MYGTPIDVCENGKVVGDQAIAPMCQECDELRLGVPGVCLGEAGDGAGKRCKWLIIKPLEPATTV